MQILDAQVHPPLPLEPWGFEFDAGIASVVAIELASAAMEAVGIEAGLIYGDAELCRLAAKRYPGRFRGVVSVGDPARVGNAAAFVDAAQAGVGIVGVRILGDEPQGELRRRFLAEGRWEPLLSAAENRSMPVVVFAPLRAATVGAIALKHPRLALVVDHLGLPPPPQFARHTASAAAVADLVGLASLPNVAVKLTGAPSLSAEQYPFRDLWPTLRAILDAFGPDRVMWGSDFTRVTGRTTHPRHPEGRHTYAQLLEYIREPGLLRVGESDAVLSGTARTWFRWPT